MDRIFWVDLEMTGLDPEESVIIEFAGIVTDLKFRELGRIHEVVFQPQEELDKMNDWNVQTHTASGLLDLIPSGRPLGEVEENVISFLAPFFTEEKAILAGNSIHQDRRFIDRHMSHLAEYLHYRMIDVSAFKLVYKHIFKVAFEKKNTHRAFDDITESIAELKHYLGFVQLPD